MCTILFRLWGQRKRDFAYRPVDVRVEQSFLHVGVPGPRHGTRRDSLVQILSAATIGVRQPCELLVVRLLRPRCWTHGDRRARRRTLGRRGERAAVPDLVVALPPVRVA